MIGNIVSGNGFRGVLAYVLRGSHQPEIVGGNMLGLKARTLALEFGLIRSLRADIVKPVWHISLSAPTTDKLSHADWNLITEQYLKKMGIDIFKHQYIVVRHRDKEHDHVHLVVNRIGVNGKVFHNRNDRYASKKVLREIEREHGLTQVREYGKERVRERSR